MLQMRSIAAGFAAALVFAPQALAATLLVPSQFPTIQSAVNAAVSGDEIVVAPGVYAAGFNYNGKRLTVRSSGGAASTIIDLTASGGTAVTAGAGELLGTRLEGFTVRGATACALRVTNGASLNIEACRIVDCIRQGDPVGGAAIRVDGAAALISACEFANCRVEASSKDYAAVGGAIRALNDASLLVLASSFSNCIASNDYGFGSPDFTVYEVVARGGAIFATGSEVQVDNCSFDGCEARTDRGFVQCNYAGEFILCCDVGDGVSLAQGGALALDEASVGTVRFSRFGSTVACKASATTRRRNESNATPREARAQGGAVVVRNGSRLNTLDNDFAACQALSRAGSYFGLGGCGAGQVGNNQYPPVACVSMGGAIFVDGAGATVSLAIDRDTFAGPSCLAETFVAGGTALDPAVGVSSNELGAHVFIRPAGSTAQLSMAEFTGGSRSAVVAEGGTGVSVLQCGFSGNAPHGLVSIANATLVSGCVFRGTAGNPITSYGGGAGPSVLNSYFCQNTPNTIAGPWNDGGGNEFAKACLTNDCNDNNIEDSFEIANGQVPDCNANGVPDSCDIASASSDDCDENEVPDDCQYRATLVTSPSLSPVQSGTTLTHSFQGLAFAGTDVVISVLANADLSSTTETIQVKSGATVLGTLFQTGGADCTPVTGELLVPKATFNGLLTKGGTLSLQFAPSFAVTAGTCNPSSLVATVEYQPTVPGDCNGNSLPDICDILAGTEADTNGDFIPDSCQDLPACPADLNLDGQVGAQDLAALLAAWGTANAQADLNDDGAVNAVDLGLLLTGWGACP